MVRYGEAMIDDHAWPETVNAVEVALRERLARDEATAGTIAPVLRHLIAHDDNSIFSDEIVARVRGMVGDIAWQLIDRQSIDRQPIDGPSDRRDEAAEASALSAAIAANQAFLCHIHALALEWQLTERLQARLGLDPVLPPLLQALIESTDPAIAESAMQLLASQARFGQAQRRMTLSLAELPGDLLHAALIAMRTLAGPEADARAVAAEASIRADFDESRSRLGLISRLVTGMGAGSVAALSVGHAGVAIFLTALAAASGQDRDLVALSTNEAQLARFAIALRAAGLKLSAIEEQFFAIHPDIALPDGFDRLDVERAAALLGRAS